MYRKVMVRRKPVGRPLSVGSVPGRSNPNRRRLLADVAARGAPDPVSRPAPAALRPLRLSALVVGLIALLLLIGSEVAVPGIVEMAFAAVLLGFGLSAVGPRAEVGSSARPGSARRVLPDPQEQVRWHLRVLQRRRQRCLETLREVQNCAAAERIAGRPSERLEAAIEALSAAVAACDAGILREQAAGMALRVTCWLERLPAVVDGWERLDEAACRRRLELLARLTQDGVALAAELREHPCAGESGARRALALLEAGQQEAARVRIDLLTRRAALLACPESANLAQLPSGLPYPPSAFTLDPPGRSPGGDRVPRKHAGAAEAALDRCWGWLCRAAARREIRGWGEEAPAAAAALPEPVTIRLPRGRDLGMLPCSVIWIGFATVHASLWVGAVAPLSLALLLPMAAFYSLFLIPGVLLLRDAGRIRRREELTVCGSSVILRWRWILWHGVETIVASPDAPVRREEIAHSGEQPIYRLFLEGLDGRRLYFGCGLSQAQQARVIRQIGRQALPLLPGLGAEQSGEGITEKRRADAA